jgi:hypothetical protein
LRNNDQPPGILNIRENVKKLKEMLTIQNIHN